VHGYVIATLVGLGLLAYLAASWVGVGGEPEPGETAVRTRVRGVLGKLHEGSSPLLAVIWIGYGLLHLITPVPAEPYTGGELSSAELQVPESLKSQLVPIWYGSGAFEIALGLSVVQKKWRRWSLLAQLLMLIAVTPFVIHILGQDAALMDLLRGLPPSLGRVVLVFHNLLLFVWVARVYRDERERTSLEEQKRSSLEQQPPAEPRGAAGPPGGSATTPAKSKIKPVTIVALVMFAANSAGCLVIAVGPWRSGALYLWAIGSLATGALIGFLFGVPRWIAAKGQPTAVERTRYVPNTNIEKLSDWLTKMLVGVGLVELHELGPTLSRASSVLAAGLTLRPGRVVAPGEAQAFAVGLVAYFLVAGLIQGFLLTRMFITGAWNEEA